MDKEELIDMWEEELKIYNDALGYHDQEDWVGKCYDWYYMKARSAATPPNPIPEGNSQIHVGDLVKWIHTGPELTPYGIVVVSDEMKNNGIGIGRGWAAKLQIMWGASGAISTVNRSNVQLCI